MVEARLVDTTRETMSPEMSPRSEKLGAIAALALAAASTGVIVPALRALVEQTGHGSREAGVFMAAHVVGGAAGAALGTRALRIAGSARRLAIAGLAASVLVTLAMALAPTLELRLGLRLVDGACHLLAITALVAAGTSGSPELRARRAVTMGLSIVLGVASGLGIGALIKAPVVALVASAGLSALAILPTALAVAATPPSPVERTTGAHVRAPLAPGLLAFCERFCFGSMTVAMAFLASSARVGMVLGLFMTSSVVAMGGAWATARALGPRRLAVRSSLGFTAALAVAIVVDVLASPLRAALWAIVGGAAAGALYASALVLATRSPAVEDRTRGMATVHAAGSAGHALGALVAGTLAFALPGMLIIAVPSIAVISVAAIGVWLTVPDAARDCPVIGESSAALPTAIAHDKRAPSQG